MELIFRVPLRKLYCGDAFVFYLLFCCDPNVNFSCVVKLLKGLI